MVTDHRKGPRRRGEALNAAILRATLDELSEHGYARLAIERVAERAGTGKAAVYRRWPSKILLVLDAVRAAMPPATDPIDTGSLRGDLLANLREVSALLAGPAGEALRGLLSDVLREDVQVADLRRETPGHSQRMMEEIVRRAVARGEVDPADVTERRLESAHAMLRHNYLFHGRPVPDQVIVEIVDEVVVPLLVPGGAHHVVRSR